MEAPSSKRPASAGFVERQWILWLGFAWGFAEATLFFIVPDVLFTLVALYSPRRSVKLVALILLGAMAGGTVMFYLGSKDPARAESVVVKVPFVSTAMFTKTREGFERDGMWTLAKSPGNGIPYKVYCVQAATNGRWPLFILISVLARLERFAPFWLVSAALGIGFRQRICRRPAFPAMIHAVLWTLGYTWYWIHI
jgi:membrane protein YqaA with SNARE-associated domain